MVHMDFGKKHKELQTEKAEQGSRKPAVSLPNNIDDISQENSVDYMLHSLLDIHGLISSARNLLLVVTVPSGHSGESITTPLVLDVIPTLQGPGRQGGMQVTVPNLDLRGFRDI